MLPGLDVKCEKGQIIVAPSVHSSGGVYEWADPDAEIDVSMNYWNDAAATWAKVVGPLRLAGNMVGVILVRADEVAEMANGAPTKNRVSSLQAHKSLPAIVTAHVQVRADHSAHLIEVRSSRVSVPTWGQALGENPLGEVLDLLSPAGGFAAPSVSVPTDERAEAVELFEAMRELPDDVKADLKKWSLKTGHRLTENALAESTEARAALTAWLNSPADGEIEPEEINHLDPLYGNS